MQMEIIKITRMTELHPLIQTLPHPQSLQKSTIKNNFQEKIANQVKNPMRQYQFIAIKTRNHLGLKVPHQNHSTKIMKTTKIMELQMGQNNERMA